MNISDYLKQHIKDITFTFLENVSDDCYYSFHLHSAYLRMPGERQRDNICILRIFIVFFFYLLCIQTLQCTYTLKLETFSYFLFEKIVFFIHLRNQSRLLNL